MGLDIKFPIGLMFTIFGIMLTIFGFFTTGNEMYVRSLSININLWSGIFMVLFGVSMLIPAIMQRKKKNV
ncbi:MAG: hypothetical protein JXB34_15110 [Bacteroidales bacterium]|nr:hypothetical protein [Bacteroidales bacterium]